MKLLKVVGLRHLRKAIGVCALLVSPMAWASLGASVTLAPTAPTDIYPGETTTLRITLSNSNSASAITGVAFNNTLPGTLPNGLKVSGTAVYSCIDGNGAVATTGTVTATLNGQGIALAGASIPAKSGATEGSCVIDIPVTAGTNTGSAVTYAYTIASGEVIGTDGSALANVGSVSQSINVRALSKPTIAKTFASTTLTLGGASTTLTLTITNPNPVALTGVGITDVFPSQNNPNALPAAAVQGVIKVAAVPAATAVCSAGGTAPTFNPAAGDTTVNATAGTLAANGTCTITVTVEANHTGGAYSVSPTNTINASTQFVTDVGLPAAADATQQFTVRSPLAVAKTVNHSTLAAGSDGIFTITLTNNGAANLTASFTDAQIDNINGGAFGLTVQSTTNSCGGTLTTTGVNEGVSLANGIVPANGSCVVTITFRGNLAAANTPQAFYNILAAGAVSVGNAAIVSQAVSASVTIYDTFNVSKAGPTPNNAAAGSAVQYQVTVQNWSAGNMDLVTIDDALTQGQTFLTGTLNGVNYTPTVTAACGNLTAVSALGALRAQMTINTVPQRSADFTPGACVVTFWAMTGTDVTASPYTNLLDKNTVCIYGTQTCNGLPSNTTTGTLAAVLTVSKGYSPAGPLNEGVITRMTITMSNLSVNALTSVAVSQNLPQAPGGGQMRVATPANAATTCGGTPVITAVAGSTSLQLNGATIPARAGSGTGAAGSCTLQVDVVAAAGVYTDTAGLPTPASVTGTQIYANGSSALAGPVTANATITFNSALCSGTSCSKTFSPSAVSSGGRSTVTIRLANAGALALTGVGVTDALPTGMLVGTPANAYTSCSGASTITAVAGSNTFAIGGATIAGNATCDLVFDVIATGTANWTNTLAPGKITANGGISNQSAVVGVLNYSDPTNLAVAKATNPSSLIFPGEVSQLTITVTNGIVAVTNLRLSDFFTANGTAGAAANGMVVAPAPAASTTCPGGVVTAVAGARSVALSGASLAAGATCTVTVNVTSTAVGGITNFIPANAVLTDQGMSNSGQASTSLTTQSNVGITKKFTPNLVKPGGRSRLRITFYNPTAQPVTNLSVTDNLPLHVTVPVGAAPFTNCAGATVTAPTSGSVQLSGARMFAASGGLAATCYAEIDVLVDAAGDYLNTIPASAISAIVGGAPVTNTLPTSDTLRAKMPLLIHKAFSNWTLDAGNPTPFTTGTDTKGPGMPAVMSIQLTNPNATDLTQTAFTDTLPTNLVLSTSPDAAGTCGGTLSASPSGTSIRLSGATIPANASCRVTVNVLSNISGSYTNSIAAGAVSTFEGVSNEEPTSAKLLVSTPPTVAKQFSPSVIAPNAKSTLTIVLGNSNTGPLTLTSVFTDTLPTAPGAIVIAAAPHVVTTCPGTGVGLPTDAVTAAAGATTVSYASAATIPAGGCTISVDVTGTTPGNYNNNIPAGSLVTDFGRNQQPANAPLVISTLGYVSGKVFQDNNVTPNGTFEQGIDSPLSGVSIELHGGANCSAPLVAQTGLTNAASTDALGNYLFSGLNAGTYSVCEPTQPAGTVNGITTAGFISIISSSTGTPGTASDLQTTPSQVANIVLGADPVTGGVSGSANNNFAEVVLSSISGLVFLDQNNNGVQDGVDMGIVGVALDLLDSGNNVVKSTTTDGQGSYTFSGLQPGTYTVREPNQPAGTSNGFTIAGAVGHGGTAGSVTSVTTLPSLIGSIMLPPATAATGNNFAEIPNGRTLSGRVFLDFNNNGLLDGGDYGLVAQTLNLTGLDANGNAVSRSVSTVADGSYSFTGLPESSAAAYTVTLPTVPPGTSNGISSVGSTGGTATAATVSPAAIAGINLMALNIVSANNNFAVITGPAPDLTIAKTHSPSSFAAGSSSAYYTITPGNVGTRPSAGQISIVDTLPAGITLAQLATGNGWTCSGAVGASSFTCTSMDVIAAGATGQTIRARVAVASGLNGQILTNTAVISGGGEPVALSYNNTATDDVVVASSAAVTGHVWLDKNHDGKFTVGSATDVGQGGWTVELLLGGALVGSTTTLSDGSYTLGNLAPGSGYQLRFRNPTTNQIWGKAVPNETGATFVSGVAAGSTDGAGLRTGANPAGAVVGDGTLSNLTLTSGTTTVQQSLPLDPAGVVYDAVTRQPVAGAVVTISGPFNFVPATDLVSGQANFTTQIDGLYQFLLNATAPAGQYTLSISSYPAGYSTQPSALIPVCTTALTVGSTPAPALVQTSDAAPATSATLHVPAACPSSSSGLATSNQATTQYYSSFVLSADSANVVNNHIPLDPLSGSGFVLSKTADRRIAQIGDSVRYTVEVRLNASGILPQVTVRDRLPPGFTFIRGTVQINGVSAPNPMGGLGPVLGFNLGSLRGIGVATGTAPQLIKLQYRVRVGVGAAQGNGINTARAIGCSQAAGCLDPATLQPITLSVQSNQGQYKVEVSGGVFTDEACVLGKIFVDCNNNHVQEPEELGIPGVRLYFEDGYYMVSDVEGKYSRCGIAPRSHVLTADPSTLPKGARLTTSSNRNLGDANSLFIDLKNGELHRADFIEGSCSNLVLEQVKARRTQGEVRSVETEKGPALRFQSKSAAYPQQGTDSANQPLVQTRQGAGDAR